MRTVEDFLPGGRHFNGENERVGVCRTDIVALLAIFPDWMSVVEHVQRSSNEQIGDLVWAMRNDIEAMTRQIDQYRRYQALLCSAYRRLRTAIDEQGVEMEVPPLFEVFK